MNEFELKQLNDKIDECVKEIGVIITQKMVFKNAEQIRKTITKTVDHFYKKLSNEILKEIKKITVNKI